MYPAPPAPAGRTEKRALASLIISTVALLLAMVVFLLGVIALLTGLGELLNFLVLGLAAMILGPIAYVLGRSAISRIAESPQTLGGRSTAVAGWIMGAAGTAAGAIVFLIWFVLVLLANFGPPPP